MGLQQQQLPEDVVLQVLSWLPFPLVLQARLVCRQWLALLSSPAFARLWPRRAAQTIAPNSDVWLLRPGTRSLIFSAIRCHQGAQQPHPDPLIPSLSYPLPDADIPAYRCAASSHGAILIRSTALRQGETHWLSDRYRASTPLLSLLNPVTNCHIRLPFHRHIIVIFSMGMAPAAAAHATDLSVDASTFYIISCGLAIWDHLPVDCRSSHAPSANPNFWSDQMGEDTVAELYDSAVGSWRLLPRLPAPLNLMPGQCDFVWWSGRFCTLTSKHVLTYDVHRDCWDTINLPTSCFTPYCTLHALKGCLFMEGVLEIIDEGGAGRSALRIGVAQFDPVSASWLEVSPMPHACAALLIRRQQQQQQAVASTQLSQRKYRTFSDTESEQIFFTRVENSIVAVAVVYHVVSRSWTCAAVSNDTDQQLQLLDSSRTDTQNHLKGFTFRPSFTKLSCSFAAAYRAAGEEEALF